MVVLDTNVFVGAGFSPRSASGHIVQAVRRGRLSMVWNDATRGEIERIVGQIPPLRGHDLAPYFLPGTRFTAPVHPEWFTEIPDPDDRKFAALAHAAGATLISSDDHLLQTHTRLSLTVLTPGAFWGTRPEAERWI